MENKVFENLDDLIAAKIQPNMHIHMASTMSRANAAINALVRCFQGKSPNFTISVTAVHGNLHAIAVSGIAKRVITGFLGDNYPKPSPNPLYANIFEKRPFEVEQWTLLTLVQRLMCSALNLPYIVTRSLIDTELINDKEEDVFVIEDPKDPEKKIVLMKPLCPDVTLVHGICGDRRGNIILSAPFGEGAWGCLAAKKGVIATVEKIISEEEMDKYSDKLIIPSNRVIAVCEVPYGAYPQAMRTDNLCGIKGYYDDYKFFVEAKKATKLKETTVEWYNKWINLKNGQAEYLDKIQKERLPYITQERLDKADICIEGAPTLKEIIIVLAARAIVQRVKQNNYKTILAGIGFSHIAAWVAARILAQEGIEIHVMAELGFYGMTPENGDIFLFSQRHAKKCEQKNSVLDILGTQVGYQRSCLGVMGAAEIDVDGNINSTLLENNKFMVGSGGASDIAAVTDCMIVVAPNKRRLVNKVSFVTSSGKNVKDVITTFGRLSRKNENETFQLETWFSGCDEYTSPQQAMDEYTSWPINISKTLISEANITDEERRLVWLIDQEGVYR